MATLSQIFMPTDMHFVPGSGAIAKAERALARYYEDSCEEIKTRTKSAPFFVSSWDGCERFICPSCKKATTSGSVDEDGEYWAAFLDAAATATDAAAYQVTTPCCNEKLYLSELDFSDDSGEKQAAICRFSIVVQEVGHFIRPQELAKLEKMLGCKLIVITEVLT